MRFIKDQRTQRNVLVQLKVLSLGDKASDVHLKQGHYVEWRPALALMEGHSRQHRK